MPTRGAVLLAVEAEDGGLGGEGPIIAGRRWLEGGGARGRRGDKATALQ